MNNFLNFIFTDTSHLYGHRREQTDSAACSAAMRPAASGCVVGRPRHLEQLETSSTYAKDVEFNSLLTNGTSASCQL